MTDTIKISRELLPLLERIDELEKLHGGLRAAANAIGIDAGYLSRLKSGEKFNPGEDVLAALGLERMTYYRDTRAELAYQDPEAMLGENRLHTVSTLVAGKAFNSLCRMLGGRWPEARMEQEAPEAYRFFMALLATPPADAADMGGQAGEEVEVVGYLDAHDCLWNETTHPDRMIPLMTVGQHQRIVAALSAQQSDPWAPSGTAYDLSIHLNPDAKAWADFFVATFPGQADKHGLMIGWFANAMMAMHDHLKAQQSAHVSVPRDIAMALLDDGPRAETWKAQAALRALLNGGEA